MPTLMLFLALALTLQAQESNPHVFLIRASGCPQSSNTRLQTGFRIKGKRGLVTALHGIAGCRSIGARSDAGLQLTNDLTVTAVDVEHDVALLTSGEVDALGAEGLSPGSRTGPYEGLRVEGHPLGIRYLSTPVGLHKPQVGRLADLIPVEIREQFQARRSPDLRIRVLKISGTFQPGHSGAPVLNHKGQLVGIANGGLKAGFSGICWAVLYEDIKWQSSADAVLLKTISTLPSEELFTASSPRFTEVEVAEHATGITVQVGLVSPRPSRVLRDGWTPLATGFWVSNNGHIATCLRALTAIPKIYFDLGFFVGVVVPQPPLLGENITIIGAGLQTPALLVAGDDKTDVAILWVKLSPFKRSLNFSAGAVNTLTGAEEFVTEKYWVPSLHVEMPQLGQPLMLAGFEVGEETVPLLVAHKGNVVRLGSEAASTSGRDRRIYTSLPFRRTYCGAPLIDEERRVVGMMIGEPGKYSDAQSVASPARYVQRVLELGLRSTRNESESESLDGSIGRRP